jgi:hypothetical protein
MDQRIGLSGARRLLGRLRGVMAGAGAAQDRLDQVVQFVAAESQSSKMPHVGCLARHIDTGVFLRLRSCKEIDEKQALNIGECKSDTSKITNTEFVRLLNESQ